MAAAPGAPAQKIAQRARKPRVQAVTTGLPCAMGYGLYVISPVNLADCHRHRRDAKHHRQLSAEPLGRQDHTISPSAKAAARQVQQLRVHRIPASHLVTIAKRPSAKGGMRAPYD